MNSILKATVCTAALAFAVPAMAQTDNMAPHHHHHAMHGKHAGMSKSMSSGDADTARLNDQSLANAKAGVMPASGSGSGSMPGATAAPGTGMTAPTTGAMGTSTPGGAMAAPGNSMSAQGMGAPSSSMPGGAMAAPSNGMSTPAAPASGAMGGATSTNAPAMAPTGTDTSTGTTPK